ncbi:MAG: o-succinylbenzoate--CoA ligase [Ignavibacteriaceae bacterium]
MNISPEHLLLEKQNPSDKAIISNEITYAFGELKNKVLETVQVLIKNGIMSGNKVGIFSTNNVDFVILVLALWQISAIPVPINTKLISSEIKEKLQQANCKGIFRHQNLKTGSSVVDFKIIEFPFKTDIHSLIQNKIELTLIDPAVIIFTSGSESKSKGVILSFESLFNSAVNSNHLLRYTNSDRWLVSLPFYHVGGFSIITRSLIFGIPLIIPDSLNPEDLKKSIDKFQPTYISLVAAQLKYFVKNKIEPNAELKNCLLGGGYSENELIKNAIELGWPINKVYGSTETSSFVTALLADEFIFKPNSVGRAIPSNKILIVDENRKELNQFEIGEVVVNSNSLLFGYLDQNETQKVFNDGYYFTGDLGYLDEDGYLFIVGRKNHLISTGGENVNPKEVEDVLLLHPMILEAAVFPLEDEKWGEIVAAALVLKDESSKLSYDEIKLFLQNRIASFKIPKKIYIENQLPKTELGKVEKEKLIKRYML